LLTWLVSNPQASLEGVHAFRTLHVFHTSVFSSLVSGVGLGD